jgi:hypothetical protein
MTTVRLELDLPASVKLLSMEPSQERGSVFSGVPQNPADLIDAGPDQEARGSIVPQAAALAFPGSGEAIDAGSAPVDPGPLGPSATPSSISTSPTGIDAGRAPDLQPPLPPGAGPQPAGTQAPTDTRTNGRGSLPPDAIARTIE